MIFPKNVSSSDASRVSLRDFASLMALTAVHFINLLDFIVVMPLGPRYREHFAMSPSQFGHVVACYGFAAFASGIASSGFIDRFDRRRVMLIGFALFSLSTLSCGLAESYLSLLFARSCTGLFGGVVGSMTMTIIGDLFQEGRRGFAFGIIGLAFSLASIFGIPIALWIADSTQSVRAPFVALSGIAAIVFLILWYVLPELKGHIHSNSRSNYWSMIRTQMGNPDHRVAYLFSILLVFGSFTVAPYIATYMVSNVGLQFYEVKYIYIVGGIASFLVMPLLGRITDRVGKFPAFLALALTSIIPTLIITNLNQVALITAVVITTFYMAVTSGRMIPAQALLMGASQSSLRAGFMSINTAIQHLSCGLAASLSAAILGGDETTRITNYPWVGCIAIVAVLLCLPVAWRLHYGLRSNRGSLSTTPATIPATSPPR